jgi:hypothetical protein
MILNGSSQQCPRSWAMTQQWTVLTALMNAVVIAAAFPPAHYAVRSLHGRASRGPSRSNPIGQGTIVRMTLAVPDQALTCATTRGDV